MIFLGIFLRGGGRQIQVCPRAPDTLATPLSWRGAEAGRGRDGTPSLFLKNLKGGGGHIKKTVTPFEKLKTCYFEYDTCIAMLKKKHLHLSDSE